MSEKKAETTTQEVETPIVEIENVETPEVVEEATPLTAAEMSPEDGLQRQLTVLQDMNNLLLERLQALESKTRTESEIEEKAAADEDDRKEFIDVYFDKKIQRMPKDKALDALTGWYINKQNKIPESSAIIDKKEKPVNSDICYVSLRRYDPGSEGFVEKKEAMFLYAAADRRLRRQDITLITKAEYDAYMAEKAKDEKNWEDSKFRDTKQKALEKIMNSL